MSNSTITLSVEQQFQLRKFVDEVGRMSHAQAQSSLVELYTQMMLKENSYKAMLAKAWGIDAPKLGGKS